MGGVLWVRVSLGGLFRRVMDLDGKRYVKTKQKYGATLESCLASMFMWVDYPNNLVAPPQLLQLVPLEVHSVRCSVLMKIRLKSLPENAEKKELEDAVMLHNLRPDFVERVRVIRIAEDE